MSRKMLAAFAVAIALVASRADAWAPLECSPGFWKTHLLGPAGELCPSPSFTFTCPADILGGGTFTCTQLVALLDPHNQTTFQAAAACLNIVAQDQLGGVTIVCEEDN